MVLENVLFRGHDFRDAIIKESESSEISGVIEHFLSERILFTMRMVVIWEAFARYSF